MGKIPVRIGGGLFCCGKTIYPERVRIDPEYGYASCSAMCVPVEFKSHSGVWRKGSADADDLHSPRHNFNLFGKGE